MKSSATRMNWDWVLDLIPKRIRKVKKNSHKFFCNTDCKYFPCHKHVVDLDTFSCLFCFCPLYPYDCEGDFIMKDKKKDCSHCLIPHEDYNYVITFLKNELKK